MNKKELLNEISLLYLLQSSGGVPSRIRLQKLVCLAKYQNASPFSFDFQSHYYGPYSEALRSKTDELVQRGLVSETVSFTNNGSAYLYNYRITSNGRIQLSRHSKEFSKDLKIISDVIRKYGANSNEIVIRAAKDASGLESTK